MLAEIQELQNDAVSQLIATLKSTPKDSYTFRAPTGSGKTYMMADFMNRILENNKDVIFLVSSLSKELFLYLKAVEVMVEGERSLSDMFFVTERGRALYPVYVDSKR